MAIYTATYKDVDAALKAVEVAVEDCLGDNPELEAAEDSVYHDMVQAVMYDCDVATARELGRITGVVVVSF